MSQSPDQSDLLAAQERRQNQVTPSQPSNSSSDGSEGTTSAVIIPPPSNTRPIIQTRQSFFGQTRGARIDNSHFGEQVIHHQYVFNSPPLTPVWSPSESGMANQANAPEDRQQQTNMSLTIHQRSHRIPSRILSALARAVRRRRRYPETQITNFPPMDRDAFQVYKRHMLPKRYGYPLWIPHPNMRLPVPYRQTGVCIGDVGIITREGAFDCLFNICLPKDHPINSQVPDDFEPLSITSHHPILEYRSFSWGTFLASNDILASQTHLNGMHFETSAPEGAILTMPRGAHVQRLANPCQFNDYIAANAESWYRFVNGRLIRGADNGDLRIVTGCHKSTVWGMATVFNSSQYTTQSHRLRFNAFQPTQTFSSNLLYFWEVSGSVLAKVGPEAGDNDGLSDNQAHELRNQCLFVDSYSVSIRSEMWSKITPKNSIKDTGGNTRSLDFIQGPISDAGGSVRESTFFSGTHEVSSGEYDTIALQSDIPPTNIDRDHSKAINKFLLRQDPNMRVAITEDNAWCMTLGKDDPAKIDTSILYARMYRLNNVRKTNHGLVHFELKDLNPDKPPILCTGREADDLLETLQQSQKKIKQVLVTHFSDLRELLRAQLGYHSNPSNSGSVSEELPPYLMEHPEDLFVFDKLLEMSKLNNYDPILSPPPLEQFTKAQLYQKLDLPTLSDAFRRRYLKALADAAWNGYLQFGRQRDLDETIFLYQELVSLIPVFSVQSLVPMFGLCSALYRRYFINRNLRDLVHLSRYIRRQEMLNLDDLVDALANQTVYLSQLNGKVTFLKPRNKNQWNNIIAINESMDTVGSSVRAYRPSLFNQITRRLKTLVSNTDREDPFPKLADESSSPRNSKFGELLGLTEEWVRQKESSFSVLWFYGPSATTMVTGFVEQLPGSDIESYVISTSNFSDKAAWNNEVYELFPAIAVELAFKVPGLLEYYMGIPREIDEQTMDASLGIQFWDLIVDPLRKILPSRNPGHILMTIIINGLDSCGYKTARVVINLIAEALVMFSLPLRFIIASNKNPRLQDVFDRPLLSKISRQYFVGTQTPAVSPNIVSDPKKLRKKLEAFCEQNPMLLTPDILDLLVERSRGSTLYAETVLRFISTIGEDPTANLSYFMQPAASLKPGPELRSAFADLDCLFTKILSTHSDRNTLVHALGILLVLHDCAQPQTIAQNIFGLLPRSDFFSSVLKVLQSMMHLPEVDNERPVHPWLAVMTKVPNKDQRALKSPYLALAFLSLSKAIPTAYTIPLAFRDRVHDSFYDFLVNPERSGSFHIDIPYFHGQVAMRGFAFVTHQIWRDWRPPKLLHIHNAPTFSLETWDYLKFHLPDHYAQCSDTVRERIMEQLQDALKAAMDSAKDRTDPNALFHTEVFINKVVILIELMIKDWDSSGEWSHYASKEKSRRASSDKEKQYGDPQFHLHSEDKHENFHQLMDSFTDDELFARRSVPRRRRLSNKFIPDFHTKERDSGKPLLSAPPIKGTANPVIYNPFLAFVTNI